ncbi:MAG: ATP-binding protein [Myxococcota bacterium]|jgi:hypothetical protein|nr:ATP-binding protein [Myxococcota bacterium]
MPRFFNTAGPCLAEDHYMLPPEQRLGEVRDLIAAKAFFVIHAPRQSGKTTFLRNLSRSLTAEGAYAALTVSLETFTIPFVDRSIPQLLRRIAQDAAVFLPKELLPPNPAAYDDRPLGGLKDMLSDWARTIDRPLVVLFDEVDSVPGETLLSILRQLRDGYCTRPGPFPQSVALVGMKDVRDYKIQLRDESQSLGTASPFNIKTRSLTLASFTQEEMRELLEQHTAQTGQRFADDAIAEIFEQSQGQPWLTNALAAQLTTSYDALVRDRTHVVERHHVLEASEILIERRDTHLDSLVARLQEERVRKVVQPVLTGELATDPTYDDDWTYVRDLGLVSIRNGVRAIANPIYQEIIPRILTHQVQTSIAMDPKWYVAKDGALDMLKVLGKFLDFWRRHAEVLLRGMPYQEAAPHLVLMAWLQRVCNGGGHIHREFAVGTLRADLVVTFGGRDDVIEIKLQRDKHTLPEGLEQTVSYAKRLGRDVGYLVIFDPRSTVPWEERGGIEEIEGDGVKVVVVRG